MEDLMKASELISIFSPKGVGEGGFLSSWDIKVRPKKLQGWKKVSRFVCQAHT